MEELRHYGVLGMKWGVRKDRKGPLRQGRELRQAPAHGKPKLFGVQKARESLYLAQQLSALFCTELADSMLTMEGKSHRPIYPAMGASHILPSRRKSTDLTGHGPTTLGQKLRGNNLAYFTTSFMKRIYERKYHLMKKLSMIDHWKIFKHAVNMEICGRQIARRKLAERYGTTEGLKRWKDRDYDKREFLCYGLADRLKKVHGENNYEIARSWYLNGVLE